MPQADFGDYERALHHAARLQGLSLIRTGDVFALVDYKLTGASLDEIAAFLTSDRGAETENRRMEDARRIGLRAMLKAERTLLAELEQQKRKSGERSSEGESAEVALAEIRRRISEIQEGNRQA